MKRIFLASISICFFIITSYSQVESPGRIQGKYTGDLKKGLAHGNGKSVGIDTYEGKFKKGIPKGEGTYTFGEDVEIDGKRYSKGDKYVGEFSEGLFNGKGKIISGENNKTIIEGYWAAGKYKGKSQHGYEIISQAGLERVNCTFVESEVNNITISGLGVVTELDTPDLRFSSNSALTNIPSSKYPFTIKVDGRDPTTGLRSRLMIKIEWEGTWYIDAKYPHADD